MKKFNKILLLSGLISLAATSTGCSATNVTDYSKEENWVIKRNLGANASYDVFFFIGTSVNNPTHDNGVGDICDEMRTSGIMNFTAVGSQLTMVKSNKNNGYNANVYVPLYRQMSLSYELSTLASHEDLPKEIRSKEPGTDLKASLDYYFTKNNKNAERPFVLAGHSQGSAALQVMFEDYFLKGGHKSYLKNCVAAYSIGYGVSKKWYDALDTNIEGNLKFNVGSGALDTHCMLSWNTEGPNPNGKSILLPDDENDTYIINPLNWKTDDTQATKDENLGVLIKNPEHDTKDPLSPAYVISTEEDDKFDAKIDLKRGCLVSNEPNSGTYVFLPPYGAIWGGKSLHCSDGSAFYVNMARNLGDRLDTWFGK